MLGKLLWKKLSYEQSGTQAIIRIPIVFDPECWIPEKNAPDIRQRVLLAIRKQSDIMGLPYKDVEGDLYVYKVDITGNCWEYYYVNYKVDIGDKNLANLYRDKLSVKVL